MKIILPFLLLFSSLTQAQINVTSSQFPTTGDTLRLSVGVLDQGLDFQSTGANHVWDFSALVPDSQRVSSYLSVTSTSAFSQLYFGSFASTPYRASYYTVALDFPISGALTGLPISIDKIIQFSKITADSLTNVGFAVTISGSEIPVKSDTIEKTYDFPLTFQKSWHSKGYTKLDMNPIYNIVSIQHRDRQSEIDGWGSITTPYGTFDVLRVHHTITESDSIYFAPDTLPGTWTELPAPLRHEYEWISTTEKEPVLRITTNDLQGTEVITNITYRDIYRVLGVSDLASPESKVYPNPVQNQLYFQAENELESISVFSVEGKKLLTAFPNSKTGSIDVEQLQSGTYQLVCVSAGKTSVKTFTKL